jgi:hypothetical protein
MVYECYPINSIKSSVAEKYGTTISIVDGLLDLKVVMDSFKE